MNRIAAILYGLAIGFITLLFARQSLDVATWLFLEHRPRSTALGVTGLLLATLGPIMLSVCVWLMARRLERRWLAHLIFIPAAILIYWGGAILFFYGAGAGGDYSIEGYAILTGGMYLFLTLLVHTAALIVEGYKKVRRRANGS